MLDMSVFVSLQRGVLIAPAALEVERRSGSVNPAWHKDLACDAHSHRGDGTVTTSRFHAVVERHIPFRKAMEAFGASGPQRTDERRVILAADVIVSDADL